ncbi:MAG: sodium/proton-translocating pyrophosphatase [Janthinobacterium lividum]
MRQDARDVKMRTITGYTADGVIAFLWAGYWVLVLFALITSAFLSYLGFKGKRSSPAIIIAFLPAAVGSIVIKIATKANMRTAQAARTLLS